MFDLRAGQPPESSVRRLALVPPPRPASPGLNRCESARRAAAVGEARDAALLAAVAFDRNADAFAELHRLHAGAVKRAAKRICGDAGAAEAIAQRTFEALWVRGGRIARRPIHVRQWLLTAARSAAAERRANCIF